MEGTVAFIWQGIVILFIAGAMAWLWKLATRQLALEKEADALRMQLADLRGTIRLLATGTAVDCVEQGERILFDRRGGKPVPDAVAVRLHSNHYCNAIGEREWEAIEAFADDGPVFKLGGRKYTLGVLEVEHEDYAGYGTPYSGSARYVIAKSSVKAENAGTKEWPHLTDEAHARLRELLEALYGEGEEA